MLGKTILLVTADKAGARKLSSCLRGAGNDVVRAETTEAAVDLIGARAIDLVLLDYAGSPELVAVIEAAATRVPVVVLSTRPDPSILLDLVCEQDVQHLLACTGEADEGAGSLANIDAREVVITAEKILRQEMFGIDKYLPGFGVEMSRYEVKAATDRDEVVECVQDYLRWLGAGRDVRNAMALVADELTTNAVYNAPRDAAGNPRYASTSRREKIVLDPWEHATVAFGSDGETFVMSVTDRFGALSTANIREGLRRCLSDGDQIEQKDGGAGLGLFTVLSSCRQLVFNIEPGVRTEVIAIADLRRDRSAAASAHSIHLFTDRKRVADAATVSDGTPTPVQLSESMLIDLRSELGTTSRTAGIIPLVRLKTVPEPEPEPVTPRGTMLQADAETPGLDTSCARLRGCSDADSAVEIALRFISNAYAGAVAYVVEDGQLIPSQGAGYIREWSALCAVDIGMDQPCNLAQLACQGSIASFRPSSPLDFRLAALLAGLPEAGGTVIPVAFGGAVRYVLYAAGSRTAPRMPPFAFETLRAELEAALERLDTAAAPLRLESVG